MIISTFSAAARRYFVGTTLLPTIYGFRRISLNKVQRHLPRFSDVAMNGSKSTANQSLQSAHHGAPVLLRWASGDRRRMSKPFETSSEAVTGKYLALALKEKKWTFQT